MNTYTTIAPNADPITRIRRLHAGCLVMPTTFTDPAIICAGLKHFLDYNLFEPTDQITSLVLALPHESAECRYVVVRATAPIDAPLESALLQIEGDAVTHVKFSTWPYDAIKLKDAFTKLIHAGSKATLGATFDTPMHVLPIQALRSSEDLEA